MVWNAGTPPDSDAPIAVDVRALFEALEVDGVSGDAIRERLKLQRRTLETIRAGCMRPGASGWWHPIGSARAGLVEAGLTRRWSGADPPPRITHRPGYLRLIRIQDGALEEHEARYIRNQLHRAMRRSRGDMAILEAKTSTVAIATVLGSDWPERDAEYGRVCAEALTKLRGRADTEQSNVWRLDARESAFSSGAPAWIRRLIARAESSRLSELPGSMVPPTEAAWDTEKPPCPRRLLGDTLRPGLTLVHGLPGTGLSAVDVGRDVDWLNALTLTLPPDRRRRHRWRKAFTDACATGAWQPWIDTCSTSPLELAGLLVLDPNLSPGTLFDANGTPPALLEDAMETLLGTPKLLGLSMDAEVVATRSSNLSSLLRVVARTGHQLALFGAGLDRVEALADDLGLGWMLHHVSVPPVTDVPHPEVWSALIAEQVSSDVLAAALLLANAQHGLPRAWAAERLVRGDKTLNHLCRLGACEVDDHDIVRWRLGSRLAESLAWLPSETHGLSRSLCKALTDMVTARQPAVLGWFGLWHQYASAVGMLDEWRRSGAELIQWLRYAGDHARLDPVAEKLWDDIQAHGDALPIDYVAEVHTRYAGARCDLGDPEHATELLRDLEDHLVLAESQSVEPEARRRAWLALDVGWCEVALNSRGLDYPPELSAALDRLRDTVTSPGDRLDAESAVLAISFLLVVKLNQQDTRSAAVLTPRLRSLVLDQTKRLRPETRARGLRVVSRALEKTSVGSGVLEFAEDAFRTFVDLGMGLQAGRQAQAVAKLAADFWQHDKCFEFLAQSERLYPGEAAQGVGWRELTGLICHEHDDDAPAMLALCRKWRPEADVAEHPFLRLTLDVYECAALRLLGELEASTARGAEAWSLSTERSVERVTSGAFFVLSLLEMGKPARAAEVMRVVLDSASDGFPTQTYDRYRRLAQHWRRFAPSHADMSAAADAAAQALRTTYRAPALLDVFDQIDASLPTR